MRSWRCLKGDNAAAKSILAIIVVVLLVTSTVGAYVLLFTDPAAGGVGDGDTLMVDYTGKFADGRVFDTSLYSVANDSDVPKSLFFSMKGNETRYNPLEMKIGGWTSSGMRMIPGFEEGVRGMKVGETKTFNVSVAQGYGDLDPKLKKVMKLEDTMVAKQTLSKAEFKAMFGHDPVAGGINNAKHSLFGIDARYHIEGNNVVVEFNPSIDQTYQACASGDAKGWSVKVTSIKDGVITLKHQLTEDDNFMVRGYDQAGFSYTNPQTQKTEVKRDLFIDEVDVDAGTFVMNYDREVKGRVLTFTVTLVSVA